MGINAETAKWLQNKTVVLIAGGVGAVAFWISGYISEIDRAKKHVDDSPARIVHYNGVITEQKVMNAILVKDLKSAGEHRKRLELSINQINRHLERLQLVSEDIEPKVKNAKNKKDSS